jgi:hypothetical protein
VKTEKGNTQMAFSLFLQVRRKPRLGLDAAEGDLTTVKLLAWCGSSLSKDEIAGLIASLQDLLASGADFDPDFEEKPRGSGPNSGAMDRARRGFAARYPGAGAIGKVTYGNKS